MKLPRGYLSYSAYALWKRDKAAFRQKYYEHAPSFETVETIFGKEVAKRLENNDPTLAHVPRYEKPEHCIEVPYKGIKLMGYIDSYDPAAHAFFEYKTGHQPWDDVRVARHEQLDFYSLLIELSEGAVQNQCELIWLQTHKVPKTTMFDGMELTGSGYAIEFTGQMQRFPRTIYKYERKAMAKNILAAAQEIAEDYAAYPTIRTSPKSSISV